jgi:hypothetical protein
VNSNKMLVLTASFSLAASMLASATVTVPRTDSTRHSSIASTFHGATGSSLLVAREKEPGDDRGKDGKGHKIAREKEPGDDRGRDGKGHKFAEISA